MNGRYILNADGDPELCDDLMTWAKWYETAKRQLAEDSIDGEDSSNNVRVSTVFLGLDHGFSGDSPLLWETMIFGGKHDQYQLRFATKHDALEGHQRALQLVQAEYTGRVTK